MKANFLSQQDFLGAISHENFSLVQQTRDFMGVHVCLLILLGVKVCLLTPPAPIRSQIFVKAQKKFDKKYANNKHGRQEEEKTIFFKFNFGFFPHEE